MSRRWISLPRSEGETSRQAHADLPKGSFDELANRAWRNSLAALGRSWGKCHRGHCAFLC